MVRPRANTSLYNMIRILELTFLLLDSRGHRRYRSSDRLTFLLLFLIFRFRLVRGAHLSSIRRAFC